MKRQVGLVRKCLIGAVLAIASIGRCPACRLKSADIPLKSSGGRRGLRRFGGSTARSRPATAISLTIRRTAFRRPMVHQCWVRRWRCRSMPGGGGAQPRPSTTSIVTSSRAHLAMLAVRRKQGWPLPDSISAARTSAITIRATISIFRRPARTISTSGGTKRPMLQHERSDALCAERQRPDPARGRQECGLPAHSRVVSAFRAAD